MLGCLKIFLRRIKGIFGIILNLKLCFQEAVEKVVLNPMYFDDVLLIVEGGNGLRYAAAA